VLLEWLGVAMLAEQPPVLIDPGTLALLIPIAAIVCGSIAGIVKMIIKHRERMAKIGMGLDPDVPASSAGQPQRYGG
jgi:hypothetical protein